MLTVLALAIILACWLVFGAFFVWQRVRLPRRAARRAPGSYLGFALQGVGFALVFVQAGPGAFPWVAGHAPGAQTTVAAVAVALAVGSTWIAIAAASALGRQWSFSAQIQQEHRLITEGPYAYVRHPIYLGMLGLLWAIGLALSGPLLLAAGTILYLAGFALRARSEERLLAEAFGAEFEAYRRRVPALIPRLRPRGREPL